MAKRLRTEDSVSTAAGGFLTKAAFGKGNTSMYKKAGYKPVPKSFDIKNIKEIIKKHLNKK